MNYCEIKKTDIADGKGVRVSLFVSGCRHHCEGCFQPETWAFEAGKPFDESTEKFLLEALNKPFISGLTLLGGEPMEPENQKVLAGFLEKVKQAFPNKNIWCYTGCVLENDLIDGSKSHYRTEYTDKMLSMIDVLVDGQFVLAQKNISLKFRGSENQRVLIKDNSGKWIEWDEMK